MADRSVNEEIAIALCAIFIPLLLVGFLLVLFLLFTFPSSPSFSIDLFSGQALNATKSYDSSTNLTIQFDLNLKNQNTAIGLHYPDPISLTFSYFPNISMMVFLAEYKVDSFYQGNGKTRHVRDMVVVGTNRFPTFLEGTDTLAFRVDLTATFRYKKPGTKRHKVELGCIIEVNHTTSEKIRRGFIELVKPGLDAQLAEG